MKSIERLVVVRMRYFLCLISLFVLSTASSWAQNKTEPTKHDKITVTTVSIKPDMRTDFENLIKSDYNPGITKGGGKWSDVWMSASFGNTFDYVFVAPVDGYAQFDGMSPLIKGLGKDGAAAFYAKAGRMVTNVRSAAYEAREDLSYNTKMTGPPKMAVVTYTDVAPGRTDEYENFIKNDLLPVIKKSGIAGWWMNKLIFGGDPNEYVTVALHENFAELEKGPPAFRVLGQDGSMKLMRQLPVGVVVHQERVFSRYVPELSYRPTVTAPK